MINSSSPCYRNLKVGDAVVINLLHCDPLRAKLKQALMFPIIGFNRFADPMIATQSKYLYNNHRFVSSQFYQEHQSGLWKYCLALSDYPSDIELVRVIKNGSRWLRFNHPIDAASND